MAVNNAEAEIIREDTPANITILKIKTIQNGVIPRLQYSATITIVTKEPITKTLYFPIWSLSFPIRGPVAIENTPVIIYSRGSWFTGIPRLNTLKALAKGISINPPVANRVVAANPLRYRDVETVLIRCWNALRAALTFK